MQRGWWSDWVIRAAFALAKNGRISCKRSDQHLNEVEPFIGQG